MPGPGEGPETGVVIMHEVTVRNFLAACLQDQLEPDWLMINVSHSSPHLGQQLQINNATFSQALKRFRNRGIFGKVNKVILSLAGDSEVSFYVSGGVVKEGPEILDPDDIRVYFNDQKIGFSAQDMVSC